MYIYFNNIPIENAFGINVNANNYVCYYNYM